MKTFEIFNAQETGKRKFKAILYEIFPDSCVDEVNQVGTIYNKNGITWIREYCEKQLQSIEGMSIRCEFTDEERTKLLGHGDTDIVDASPVYEDAVVIGHFEKGYIAEIEDNNELVTVCIGEGTIDSQCYHNYVTKLEQDIAEGITPSGSIEIMRKPENKEIIYKYGYKDKGRIPTEFVHSGYALLGILPADDRAKLVELNEEHKEDVIEMTEQEIKAFIEQSVKNTVDSIAEINKCKDECDKQVGEINENLEKVVNEKEEAIANSVKIQAALDECRAELNDAYKKTDGLYAEIDVLKEELGKIKVKERIGELNSAITCFSEEEKEYAKAEIEAFNADPVKVEINSVVNKIWEGIGKKAKETVVEQSSAKEIEDIFSAVDIVEKKDELNIF